MSYLICFVCLGNICRSPMAEAVMRTMVADAGMQSRIAVSSAGTGDWHVGEGADPRTVIALARRGYDASQHEARQFTRRLLGESDLVLAADRSVHSVLRRIAGGGSDKIATDEIATDKIALLRQFDPTAGTDLDVPDPYFGGPRGFDKVLDMIERACAGLLDTLAARLPR